MDDDATMTVSAAAAAVGCSVQQVRDLEALGVIPTVRRSPNGYRRITATHVRDLHAYRGLAAAVGAVVARRVMREIRTLPADEATAVVLGLHTGLAREREGALAARDALRAIQHEAYTDASPRSSDSMSITELSRALGVRSSTLRFWEQQDLVRPERTTIRAGSARHYPLTAVREARIVAALRAAGYRIPDVAAAIAAIRELRDVDRSAEALEARLAAIAQRSLALMHSSATLARIIQQS